jgi:hypothetical protein
MIEKLAPEDENKRESYIRQVYAGDAARVPYDFITDPLIFDTRTRTSVWIQLKETLKTSLDRWPLYGKRERATRFQ